MYVHGETGSNMYNFMLCGRPNMDYDQKGRQGTFYTDTGQQDDPLASPYILRYHHDHSGIVDGLEVS